MAVSTSDDFSVCISFKVGDELLYSKKPHRLMQDVVIYYLNFIIIDYKQLHNN
jgi:hypothetical protein